MNTNTNGMQAYGIALIRVVAGLTFFMHGQQKLFEMGIGGVEGFFGSLGIPAAGLAAIVVSLVETVGGLALILGALTRVAGALLAVDMLVALLVVHRPNGFFAMDGGIELVLMLGAVALGLVIAGPGALAVDAMLPLERRLQPASSGAPNRIAAGDRA